MCAASAPQEPSEKDARINHPASALLALSEHLLGVIYGLCLCVAVLCPCANANHSRLCSSSCLAGLPFVLRSLLAEGRETLYLRYYHMRIFYLDVGGIAYAPSNTLSMHAPEQRSTSST